MISVSGAEEYLPPEASGNWMASGGGEPRSIASITKLITAMVILSVKPLAGADDPGPDITFSKADHALYDKYYVLGATIAPMPAGITMSEHQALEAMLIPSASNYAEAMATWAFGSQSADSTMSRVALSATPHNCCEMLHAYPPIPATTKRTGSTAATVLLRLRVRSAQVTRKPRRRVV